VRPFHKIINGLKNRLRPICERSVGWSDEDRAVARFTALHRRLSRAIDGSVDVYLGPKAPSGFENNWGAEEPRQGLVYDPSPLWPVAAMVR
jgi:hypothetical protein